MILNLIRIKVAPRDRADAVKTINKMIGPTLVQPGCEMCCLFNSIDDDDDLLLAEKWSSQELLEKQVVSDQYKLLLEALELANKKPEIEIHTVSSTTGLELIEKLRC